MLSLGLFTKAMAATLDNSLGVNELVGLALKCGEVNLSAPWRSWMPPTPAPTGIPSPPQCRLGH